MNILYVFIPIVITIIITFMVIKFKKSRKKSETSNKSRLSKTDEFLEIETFNGDEYVNDVFNTIFYSIQNDNWKSEVEYNKIKFTKEKKEETSPYSRHTKTVSIVFSYKFESKDHDYKKKIFVIDSINLSNGGSYSSFYYKGISETLPSDVKLFVYNIYSEWINKSNEEKKKSIDKDLFDIKSVLGKASQRGSKIDELLGE